MNAMEKIKILIADDNEEIRSYFKKVLSHEEDMEITGVAKTGLEAIDIALKSHPDVIIMDIEMESRTDGIYAITKIKEELPEVKSLVLTVHKEEEYIFQAYIAGALDYLIKTTSVVDILTAVRRVYNNNLNMRPEIAQRILSEYTRIKKEQNKLVNVIRIISRLTNSEIEIIGAVLQNERYKSIANTRHVEIGTIKAQVNSILKKFNLKRMSDVIRLLNETDIFQQVMMDK